MTASGDSTNARLADEPASVRILDSERVYAGTVWDVRSDEFAYGDASIVRQYVDHTGAVAVLAMDEANRVLLIRQYRHPVGTRDWEIPAGLLDVEGEGPLETAKRELAEEADLVADEWNVLAQFTTSPGGSTEAIRIYLARGVRPAAESFPRHQEEADIEKRWVSLDEATEAILARKVENPSLTIGVLAARAAAEASFASVGAADEPWPRMPRRGRSR